MIVDEMHEEHPELLKDQYWEEVVPKELPYTVASEHYRRHEPPCSADHYKVKAEDALYANVHAPRKSHDDTYADYVSIHTRSFSPAILKKSTKKHYPDVNYSNYPTYRDAGHQLTNCSYVYVLNVADFKLYVKTHISFLIKLHLIMSL